MIICPVCQKSALLQASIHETNKYHNNLGYNHYSCFDATKSTIKTHFSCYTNIKNEITQFYLYSKILKIMCLHQVENHSGFDIGWQVMMENSYLYVPLVKGPEILSPEEAYKTLLRCQKLLAFL